MMMMMMKKTMMMIMLMVMESQALTQRFDGVLLALLVLGRAAGGDEGRNGESVGSGGELRFRTRTELHHNTTEEHDFYKTIIN